MENNYITPQFLAEHIADMMEGTNLITLSCVVDPGAENNNCAIMCFSGKSPIGIKYSDLEHMLTALTASVVNALVKKGKDPVDIMKMLLNVFKTATDPELLKTLNEGEHVTD